MKVLISEEDIQARIKNLAKDIQSFYSELKIKELYFIFILTSSFVFASDLMREISRLGLKLQTDVIKVKSYVGTSSGKLKISASDIYRNNLNDRHLLIVDDILDTGKTLTFVKKQILENYAPKSMEFCCLLEKEGIHRQLDFKIKFLGFKIPNVFAVGYGLDHDGKYRELPFITSTDQIG